MTRLLTPRYLAVVSLALVAAIGVYFVVIPKLRPSTAYSLVDQSTLLVLKGLVQLQRAGNGPFAAVTVVLDRCQ